MHPEHMRSGSNYVYVTPIETTTYTYADAVDFCLTNHNGKGKLPTIHDRVEANSLRLHQMLAIHGT